jgi:hypothetical protein
MASPYAEQFKIKERRVSRAIYNICYPKIKVFCCECHHEFNKRISTKWDRVKCPVCKSHDIEPDI